MASIAKQIYSTQSPDGLVVIIFDTNVLLSAFFFKSGLSSAVFSYTVITSKLLSSEWILNEFIDKLSSPDFRRKNRNYRFDDELIGQLSVFVQQATQLVQPTNALPTLCRDPDDNHVLQLAEFVEANYLITGDKDLLVLDPFSRCRIVSPKTFANVVGLI